MHDPASGGVNPSAIFVTLTRALRAVALAALFGVSLGAAPLYPPPVDGWAYELSGDQAFPDSAAALDGTWNHENGSDSWGGDGRGAGVGLVGGISSVAGILTLEDGVTNGNLSMDNRRLYLTRNLAQDLTQATNLLDTGVTLYFRARLTPPSPQDPLTELASAPNGFVNHAAGKGMIGLRQAGGSGMIVSFSLHDLVEDTSPSTTHTFAAAGLHMNNLSGNSRSPFVDPDGPGTKNVLALDPTLFHDFWITIVANGSDPGTHRVSIYLDGSETPTVFNVTAGTGSDGPAVNYLALGPGSVNQVGAFDLDFLAYRPGAVAPASFDQPVAILQGPQDQWVPEGVPAQFEVAVSGAPPFTYQWYRDGMLVASGPDRIYQSPPVTPADDGAQIWVVVSNPFSMATSQPPARLVFLPLPRILVQPTSQTVTNGERTIIRVEVGSVETPSFQWHNVSGPIPGATNSTLIFDPVTEGFVGPYFVTISNLAGVVISDTIILDVVVFDYGDAPDFVFPYSTTLTNNGARHLIKAGWRLGALIDGELDGLPDSLANGDDSIGVDDEDGVLISGPLVVGGTVNVDVIASANGFLQAWVDLGFNGTWTDPGDHVLVNQPISPGTNRVNLSIPEGVLALATYARFRFSSVPNLGPSGPAPDGEVEDYRVTLLHLADVRVSASSGPNPVVVGSNLTYQILVTNVGPALARSVNLTNNFSGPFTFVSAQSSVGGACAVQGNRVTCFLNDVAPRTAVSVTVVVRPVAGGTLTNQLTAYRALGDPNFANNTVAINTTVHQAPVIVVPPMDQAVEVGQPVTFNVTASGLAPFTYQWLFAGTPLAGATSSSFTIPSANASHEGSYSVRVSNPLGMVTSPAAVLSIQVPPTIVVQPRSITSLAGSSVTFSVAVSGSGPLTYRWFYNTSTLLPAPNQAFITLTNVLPQQAGQYSVQVSNVLGVVQSSLASLVLATMDLGDAPAPYPTLVVGNGARHRLREGVFLGRLIDYDGDGHPDPAAQGDDLAGVDDEDGLSFAELRLGQVSTVMVVASTNGFLSGWIDFTGNGDWDDAGERVFTDRVLVPGTNTLSISVPAGARPGGTFGRFRFSTSSGLSPVGEAMDGEVEDYRLVIGATFDLRLIPGPVASAALGGELTYSLIASNKGPSLAADVVLEQTFSGPVVFLSSQGSLGCVQEGAVIRCFLGEIGAEESLAVGVSVSPENLGFLTNQMVLQAVGSEANQADNSGQVVTSVLQAPTIDIHPQSIAVNNGQSATFTGGASGSAVTLRWRFNGVDIPGANSATLVLNNVQLSQDGLYTLFASNVVGTATSLPAQLTVMAPPTILNHPQSVAAVAGTNVTLSVSVTGSEPLTYQWEFNGGALPGAGDPTLVLTDVSTANEGAYRVRVSNPLGQTISSAAILTVVTRPSLTQQPVGQTQWAGLTARFDVVATGTPTLHYQWLWNGVPLAGATQPSLLLANVQPSQSGEYSVAVTNLYGALTSQVAQLTVWRVDFGDAPPGIYPTSTNENGAYHLILPEVYLGASVDGETDGLGNSSATGDDLDGIDDEDGVRVIGVLRAGQPGLIEVVASTNGFLDAWVDFFGTGLWVDPGDQIFESLPLQAGTNLLPIDVVPTAKLGDTFARFRFSLAGGLSFTGPAPDGEVEDHRLSIAAPFDLSVGAEPVPAEGSIGTAITYSLRVTNRLTVTATQVRVINSLGANMSYLSASSSLGSCSHANGIVTCQLGTLSAGQTASITIQAAPLQGGWATNRAEVLAAEFDPQPANNLVIQSTRIIQQVAPLKNNSLINLTQIGAAQPYPSTINVSGIPSVIDRITVTLSNITHSFPDDIDVLLVGPTGQGVILMSDAGAGNSITDVTLRFDDSAVLRLPDLGSIQGGTVRPGNFGDPNDPFPAPAPAGAWGSELSAFSGTDPNGTWSLYVVDDEDEDTGRINDGWILQMTTLGPLANLSLQMTDAPDPITIGSNLTYSVTVTNSGPSTASGVVLTDVLPQGSTFISANTTRGSCSLSGGVVTCQIGALTVGQSAQIQIQVSPLVLGVLTNSAAVRADQFDNITSDNQAVALTDISAAADLAVVALNFPGETPFGTELVYSFILTNRGTIAASEVRVEDLFPGWATVNGVTVSKGTCTTTNGRVSCDLGLLPGLSSAQFTLRLSSLATGALTNQLTIEAAEFDPNPANNRLETVTQVVVINQGGFAQQISVPSSGAGSPYPASITLAGLTTAVFRVSVTLSNLTHTRPDDLDVLLVGPQGHKVMLLSDAGGLNAVGSVTLTIDDLAGSVVADGGPIVSGQYRPSVYDSGSDFMPGPAPAAPYGSSLAVLAGTDPNGTWSLYVADDLAGAAGVLNGWSLRVATRDSIADLGVTLAGPADPVAVSSNLTYIATITNNGPATAWGVVLENPLQSRFAFVSSTSSQGACSEINGTVVCSLGSLPAHSTATVSLVLSPLQSGTVVNTVSVSGRVADFQTANNTAMTVNQAGNPPMVIARPLDLVATNGHTVSFSAVVSGDLPLFYQWFKDDEPLINKTSAVLVLNNISAPDAGSYLLRISNSVGVAFSGAASLEILQPPLITGFGDLTIEEGTSTGPIFFSVMDAESPTFALLVTAASSNQELVPNQNLRLIADTFGLNRSLTVTPAATKSGTAIISIMATDEDGLTSTNSFTLTVRSVNNPPIIGSIPSQDTLLNRPLNVLVQVTDAESPANQITLTARAANPALVQSFSFSGTGEMRTLTVVPAPSATGTTIITLTATDPDQATSTQNFSFTIGSNTRPILVPPANQSVNEDTLSPNWSFVVGDSESPATELIVTAASGNPALVTENRIFLSGTGSNRTVAVLPATNRVGTATIFLRVLDPMGLSATNSFVLTVNPVNDLPELSPLPNQVMLAGSSLGLPLAVRDEETPAGMLVLEGRSSNLSLLPNSGLVFGGSDSDRTLTLVPAPGQTGSSTVSVWVSDGNGGATTNSFLLTVQTATTQRAPIITTQPQSIQAVEGETVLFSVGVVGSAPLTYQWRFESTDLPNGTNATLTVKDISPALAGNYSVRVSNSVGQTISWPAELALLPVTASPTLVAAGSVWSYLDTGADLGTTWQQMAYDDSAWPAGPAELGYGDGGEATEVGYGPNPADRYITTYFRHRFVVRDPFAYSSLTLRFLRDDGAVYYLNGTEVFRSNMPGGPITSSTPASSDVVGIAETLFFTQSLSPSLLRAGVNVLAVEVHQINGASSDLSFDLELAGTLITVPIPTLSGLGNRTTSEDTAVSLALIIGDPITPPELLTLSVSSSSATLLPGANMYFNGTGANRTLTLIPAQHQFGQATVTVRLGNGAVNNQQSFILTVNPVNDPPTLDLIPDLSLVNGAGEFTVNLTGISRGPANEGTGSITMQDSLSSNPAVAAIQAKSYFNPQATGTQRVNPVGIGSSVITVAFSDGQAENSVFGREFTAYVRDQNNQLPTFSSLADLSVNEGEATGPISFTIGDAETPSNALTLRARSFNPNLVPESNIVFGGTGADRTLSITPAAQQSGTAQIWVMVVDQGSGMTARSFVLTVLSKNDPPAISALSDVSLPANGRTALLPFTVQDPETPAHQLSVSVSSSSPVLVPPQNVFLSGHSTNRGLIVQPALNQAGSALLTVTVSDGTNAQTSQLTLTVQPVQQPPTLSDVADLEMDEDSTVGPIAFSIFDEQTPAESLVVTVSSFDPVLFPSANLVLAGTGNIRTLSITPGPEQFGQGVITVRVRDQSGLEAIDNFIVQVRPVNDPPSLDPIVDLVTSPSPALQTVLLTGIRAGPPNELQPLALSAVSTRPDLVPHPSIRYTNGNSVAVLYFNPTASSNGTATITVGVNDGQATDSLGVRVFNIQLTSGVQILSQPQSQTVEAWEQAVFSVSAVGEGLLSYQWRKDGANLAGQTGATLVLPNLQPNQAGDYSVVVSDGQGSIVSANATLVVTARLLIVELVPGTPTRLRFNTEIGLTYTLYYKDLLSAPSWTPLGNVTGDGTVQELTDPSPAAAARFYSVWGD